MSEDEKDWQFQIAPLYLWAINIEGDLGVRGRTTNASVDFSDVYDNLEGVLTGRITAIFQEKIGIFFDYNYLDLGQEKVSGQVNVDIGFTSQFVNLGVGYKVNEGSNPLFVTVGGRYTDLESKIYLNNLGVQLEGDESWLDPTIGLDYKHQLNERWFIHLIGDIGGFGVSSDFTWQAGVLVDYQPWKHVAIVAGYRAIGTDYETGPESNEVLFDATIHGPILGVDFRF